VESSYNPESALTRTFSGRPLFSFQGTGALYASYSKKNAAESKSSGNQPLSLSASSWDRASCLICGISTPRLTPFGKFQGPTWY